MFKLNPISGQMDLVRSISDNPGSNTQDEAASTKATKVLADNIEAEVIARTAAVLVPVDNLAAEVLARAAADLVLTNNLAAEAIARADADFAIDNAVEIDINFLFIADYIYNVPRKMKFTAQTSEGTPATLSIALNTEMLPYVKLIVTPTQIGLIKLEGVELP